MCSWTNKENFPVRMYSHFMRGTNVGTTEGRWLLSKLPECSSPKTPDNSLEAYMHSPYISPYLTHKHNNCDVMIICSSLLVGKPCTCTREPHPLAHAPTSIPPICLSTAMHRPSHQFHIPNFEPVTLSPRYFGAPSYQSLKFIDITH